MDLVEFYCRDNDEKTILKLICKHGIKDINEISKEIRKLTRLSSYIFLKGDSDNGVVIVKSRTTMYIYGVDVLARQITLKEVRAFANFRTNGASS